MADVKISALLDLGTAPAANDYVPIVDASAAATKRVTIADLFTSPNVTGTLTADGLTVDAASTDLKTTGFTHTLNFNTTTGTQNTNAQITSSRADISTSKSNLRLKTNDGTSTLTRMEIDASGDLSLFEDTGTTAALFWDASAESLGLGTTIPSSTYSIDATKGIRIISTLPNLTLQESDASSHTWQLGSYGGDFSIRDVTHGTYPFTVADGGDVGIGTTNPTAVGTATTTHINGSGGGAVRLSDDVGNAYFDYRDNEGVRISVNSAEPLRFQTSSLERARIDSTGKLLIAKTSSGATNTGFEVNPNSWVSFVCDSANIPMYLENKAVGGNCRMSFTNNDHGQVSIGINSDSNFTIFDTPSASTVFAIDVAEKTIKNVNGIYLGGTGAANLLDDYEEGTFTPTLIGSTSGSISFTTAEAEYTKIGNVVTANIYLTNINVSGSTIVGDVQIGGLPFAVTHAHAGSITFVNMFTGDPVVSIHTTGPGTTVIKFREGSSTVAMTASDLDSGVSTGSLMLTVTYRTS